MTEQEINEQLEKEVLRLTAILDQASLSSTINKRIFFEQNQLNQALAEIDTTVQELGLKILDISNSLKLKSDDDDKKLDWLNESFDDLRKLKKDLNLQSTNLANELKKVQNNIALLSAKNEDIEKKLIVAENGMSETEENTSKILELNRKIDNVIGKKNYATSLFFSVLVVAIIIFFLWNTRLSNSIDEYKVSTITFSQSIAKQKARTQDLESRLKKMEEFPDPIPSNTIESNSISISKEPIKISQLKVRATLWNDSNLPKMESIESFDQGTKVYVLSEPIKTYDRSMIKVRIEGKEGYIFSSSIFK
ncbi:hypothetical protein [Mangrovibacterium diazotrophicum]|uniref:SH3 domain-containing protein n=1 Tax=Mangrovibacterium diazotrophicum TaxID=1261403 RepID=A0A419W4Q8_9BACT|nr:hypothetical protein [Mangrovibacterium diazotrophicum]RKD90437.1 hypothetical protein BC643_0776 [Mangrovibacterium diazotrophicum]